MRGASIILLYIASLASGTVLPRKPFGSVRLDLRQFLNSTSSASAPPPPTSRPSVSPSTTPTGNGTRTLYRISVSCTECEIGFSTGTPPPSTPCAECETSPTSTPCETEITPTSIETTAAPESTPCPTEPETPLPTIMTTTYMTTTCPVSWTSVTSGSGVVNQPVTLTSTLILTSVVTCAGDCFESTAAPEVSTPVAEASSMVAAPGASSSPKASSMVAAPGASSSSEASMVAAPGASSSPIFNTASSQFQKSFFGFLPGLVVALVLV
ncbi:hypothetical protein N7520_004448 [Penicillium odoratum]|uniref:uncharacterized protein n=1 Tax=Penicillium odoratum TaxID=1167516 RepID=UPI0025480B4E|nr:uncharacterized protein N7520_004448 [Penicillium odoratum]KAJ5764889.1 hypothetical protein N7520_004448 [Penicillium odoratum]